MNMKVLVTGGSGYIGSVTTRHLLDAGHVVTIFDNLERGHREAVSPGAQLVQGDLRDRDAIMKAMRDARPDAVIHFAAYALVGESMADPAMYFRNNVGGGIHLLEAMDSCGVRRLVFSSSCATYGDPGKDQISEDTPQRPTNPYGESKLMFERIAAWFMQQRGLHPVYLRYFNACGATAEYGEDHDPETHIIPLVLKTALGKRKQVQILGDDYPTPDGTCIRDYIHIVDLAQAHMLALTTKHTGAFNLGIGHGYSVKEVVDTARKVTGRPIAAEVAKRRPGDPPRLVAANGKAMTTLGWKPHFTELGGIIESAWKWHRDHPDGYAGKRN